ncbi:MAG: hypothetical protein Q7V57_15635 [Actinomycetota bacterium]|nr:hypothetical protein [Actinomycetota bacterium]
MTRRRACWLPAVWFVLAVSLWATDAQPAVLPLGAIVLVAGAAVFVTVDVAKGIRRIEWTPGVRRSGPVDDPRVVALRRQLDASRWSGSTDLHDLLVELADDRLLAHHGIDRAAAPSAAAGVLPPSVRRLVDGRRREAISMRDLQRIVTDIEAL